MTLLINDPRQYSTIYPSSNILIAQALHDLLNNDSGQLIQALIEDLLKQSQDQILGVAYNLAPSQAVADYIWHNLQTVINESVINQSAKLFAIPIVIVAGSSVDVTLSSKIDEEKLFQLLCEKNVFLDPARNYISGNLYDPEGIVKLKPSQLYHWSHSLTTLEDWSCNFPGNTSIRNSGENVHLRFLLGISFCDLQNSSAMITANFSQLGIELMQLILEGIKTDGVTLFPLPFPPCALSEAAVVGEHHRKEISVAVTLSNLVKKMRLEGKQPQLKLRSQDNNIYIEIWETDKETASKILLWPLQRADNFTEVCQILATLFNDMQLPVNYYEAHSS